MAQASGTSGVDIEGLSAKSVIRKVNLSSLKVDRSYQRDPSQRMVDLIAEDWDEVASELLLVSDRGEGRESMWLEKGRFYIVNGQHRSLAARKKGLTSVSARIVDLSFAEDPAAIESVFRIRTNIRMGDKPVERFKASLRSGDPDSLAIVDILASFDTEINDSPNTDSGINAVTTVEKLYSVDEGVLLKETLEAVRDAFGRVGGKVTTAPMLVGVGWFILKHADEVDRTRFVKQIGDSGPAALERRARVMAGTMSGSLWMNYYRVFVESYNERLKESSRLEWRTRGASTFKGSGAGSWSNRGGRNS